MYKRQNVIPSVWALLDKAYEHFGTYPTLLERDFNFPKVSELLEEVEQITELQNKHTKLKAKSA